MESSREDCDDDVFYLIFKNQYAAERAKSKAREHCLALQSTLFVVFTLHYSMTFVQHILVGWVSALIFAIPRARRRNI